MPFSRNSTSLNPNADPFLYTTPFAAALPPPPPKQQHLEFPAIPVPVPVPIFNLSQYPFKATPPLLPQLLRQLPIASSRVLWAPPPVHGYESYVDIDVGPYQQHQQQQQHNPILAGVYDVVVPPLSSLWPSSDVVSPSSNPPQKPYYSLRNNNNRSKCKIRKWVPQEKGGGGFCVRVRHETDQTETLQFPSETTTLMIKNIPNQVRRHNLLNILDEHCKWKNLNSSSNHNNNFDTRRSEYDFVYLPMDFRKYWYDGKISNLGYAFVNFTNPTAASEFCKAFHRRQWEVVVNRKVCEIKRAKFQGLKALMEAFRNKIFWCHANNYLPVVLEPPSDGCRIYRATPVGKRISRPPPSPIKKLSG